VKATTNLTLDVNPRRGRFHTAAAAMLAIAAVAATHEAEAAMGDVGGDPGHFGFVLEAAGEFGGDNLVEVFYRNGDRQNIKAGQGVTVGGGIHYRPVSIPVDFAATVGYKCSLQAASMRAAVV
jgi:hypothetical protein